MNIKNQKQAFQVYEADNWYQRNRGVKYTAEDDVVIKVLKEYSASPSSALEIGCSTGYRLHALATTFNGVRVTGIEPSQKAIMYGKEEYPEVNFVPGTAGQMTELEMASFDLVIIGFVLYVVDRDMLLKVVAETDRVLRDGGILMIIDFFSEKPARNPYQHITDIKAYAYKQNYEEIFTASKLYHLLDKRSMSHSTKTYDLSDDFYDKYAVTTLRKDLSVAYK